MNMCLRQMSLRKIVIATMATLSVLPSCVDTTPPWKKAGAVSANGGNPSAGGAGGHAVVVDTASDDSHDTGEGGAFDLGAGTGGTSAELDGGTDSPFSGGGASDDVAPSGAGGGGMGGSSSMAEDGAPEDADRAATGGVVAWDAAIPSGGTVGSGGIPASGGATGSGGSTTVPDGAILVDLAPDTPILNDSTPNPSALMVVGVVPLGSGDAAVSSRLMGKGFDVVVVADSALSSITNVTATVVFISSTSSASLVGSKFLTTPVPVMTWESQLFANMGFVDGTASGSSGETSPGATSLVVNSAAGALTAGLAGTVVVLSSSLAQINWGIPSAQAMSVASVSGEPTHMAIFAYDTGAQMYGLVAPARRMGFYLTRTSANVLTAEGWRLFDAALAWLTKA